MVFEAQPLEALDVGVMKHPQNCLLSLEFEASPAVLQHPLAIEND